LQRLVVPARTLADERSVLSISEAAERLGVNRVTGPQGFTVSNAGTADLTAVAPGFTLSSNFAQVPSSGKPKDCAVTFTLAPGWYALPFVGRMQSVAFIEPLSPADFDCACAKPVPSSRTANASPNTERPPACCTLSPPACAPGARSGKLCDAMARGWIPERGSHVHDFIDVIVH
jgi:hypothetical protein